MTLPRRQQIMNDVIQYHCKVVNAVARETHRK